VGLLLRAIFSNSPKVSPDWTFSFCCGALAAGAFGIGMFGIGVFGIDWS
jgi:hypothetical protein